MSRHDDSLSLRQMRDHLEETIALTRGRRRADLRRQPAADDRREIIAAAVAINAECEKAFFGKSSRAQQLLGRGCEDTHG